MTARIRVFINGFGRIGRNILRQIFTVPNHANLFELVGINDIAPLETCAYLLRYDSVYGPFPHMIQQTKTGLTIANKVVPFFHAADLRALDLHGVDVVLDCTGKATSRRFAEAGLDAGADAILVSGPSEAADQTIVLGANEDALDGGKIISNASCTTNAIAPLLNALDADLGIEHAHITTVHCYTGSQPTVDQPGPSLARSRAAAVSMVPTTTSAANQVIKVLPRFKNRLSVAALRVPSISVSAIDACIQIKHRPEGDLNNYLHDRLGDCPWIGLINDPCVSTDFRSRPESIILALPETQTVGTGQIRLFGWYDNEWGFSARMLDMVCRIAARH